MNKEKREVSLFITDIGFDIIIEVSDSGDGVDEGAISQLFTRGHSSKGEGRGYGLANVKEVLDELGGWIEVANQRRRCHLHCLHTERHKGGIGCDQGTHCGR